MKVVILAGGFGTRLSEETIDKPKPMVEIGGKPILWHIMKIYSAHGLNDFIICCGYKGYLIKEYFANYSLHQSDVTFDMRNDKLEIHHKRSEPWKVSLIDTGDGTMTGGRLKRIQSYLGDSPFCFTYGDGVSDVNISDLIMFHNDHSKILTLTATRPPGRFGALEISDGQISKFTEKPSGDGHYINGGFMVANPEIFNFIEGDTTVFEDAPMKNLASKQQLMAYKHDGFWQAMDTLRDKNNLEYLCQNNNAPWIKW